MDQTEKLKYKAQKVRISQSMFYYPKKILTATNPVGLQVYVEKHL